MPFQAILERIGDIFLDLIPIPARDSDIQRIRANKKRRDGDEVLSPAVIISVAVHVMEFSEKH